MTRRPRPPDDVDFPVVPMLDMAFQLLAFFILTFQAPTTETRIDLALPVAPASLPESVPAGIPIAADLADPGPTLALRLVAGEAGGLETIQLDGMALATLGDLEVRLRSFAAFRGGQAPGLAIAADDRLHYEFLARVLSDCARAGITRVRIDPAPAGQEPPP